VYEGDRIRKIILNKNCSSQKESETGKVSDFSTRYNSQNKQNEEGPKKEFEKSEVGMMEDQVLDNLHKAHPKHKHHHT